MKKPDYTHLAADYPQGGAELLRLLKRCEVLAHYDGSYFAPSKHFEKQHSIKGISANWKMPDGYDGPKLQNTLMEKRNLVDALETEASRLANDSPLTAIVNELIEKSNADYHQFLRSTSEELKRLNPELASIPLNPGNMDEAYDFVHGSASQFNKHDIHFFLEDSAAEYVLRNADTYKALEEKIGSSHIWQWIPSPETMENVIEQLKGRKLHPPRLLQQGEIGLGVAALGGLAFLGAHEAGKKDHTDTSQSHEKSKMKPFLKVAGVSFCTIGGSVLIDAVTGGHVARWAREVLDKSLSRGAVRI